MKIAEANEIFATRLKASYEDEMEYGIYLKTDNTYLGEIIETDAYQQDTNSFVKSHRFVGHLWLGNANSDTETTMKYPIRIDQFERNNLEAFVELEHMSGFNQALLDALHYYKMCISWIIPDYSPITLKG